MSKQVNMSCVDLLNVSEPQTVNITGNRQIYEKVFIFYTYGLPTICICGFLGNVMNLVILAGKRLQRMFRSPDRSTSMGLMALAVADMLFCVSAFPSCFLPEDHTFQSRGFLLYYACYCAAVINIFIMASTLLTVTISTDRYLAIRFPLKSRNIITLQRSKLVLILVFVFSALFNVPVFWRYQIKACEENESHYRVVPRGIHEDFDQVYQSLWAAIGNFIPLIVLLWCNIGLMREVHKSYAKRKTLREQRGVPNRVDKNANRITITLLAIVIMFLVLVAPSEVMKQVAFLLGGDYTANYTYRTIEVIYNLLQAINFSANFVLYCIINPSFRKTTRELFCFQYQKLNSEAFEASIGDTPHGERFRGTLRMHGSQYKDKSNTFYNSYRGQKGRNSSDYHQHPRLSSRLSNASHKPPIVEHPVPALRPSVVGGD